jgi:HSP20 family protein
MTKLITTDPFRSLWWPNWSDFDDSQRGLKIRETDKDIVVEAVVAGVPAKDVEVEIEDGVLTIKAQVSQQQEKEGVQKSSSYSYYYTTALSSGAWNKATAHTQDGVVEVRIPKAESAKKQKIAVKTKS